MSESVKREFYSDNLPPASSDPSPIRLFSNQPAASESLSATESERALRQSQAHLQGILNSSIDLVCRYTPEAIITYVNDAYAHFFGMTREQLIGDTFLRLAPEDQRKTILERLREVSVNPAPDVRIVSGANAAGRPCWIQWVDHGIIDETGAVVEIQAVGRDVTDLVRTQQHLAEREEMLDTIFRSIPIIIVQIDTNGRLDYVNQHFADLLGWSQAEISQQPHPLESLFPDPAARQEVVSFLMSDSTDWKEIQATRRDGSTLYLAANHVRLADGRLLGIAKDITQRKQLEQERQIAERLLLDLQHERELRELRDRFVSMVTHEFRSPLAVIKTYVSMLTNYLDRLTPEKTLEKLHNIRIQIDRMTNLMEDVLHLGEAETRRIAFNPQEIHLPTFCHEIVDTLRLIDAGRHHIEVCIEDATLRADPRLFDHLLSNLLSNALKYSPEGTTVALSIARLAKVWRIQITDQGIGIPADELPHLFDLFYRASNARKLPGTGLGLPIVKEYVTLHGGNIDVESTVDVGTTFTVTLPT